MNQGWGGEEELHVSESEGKVRLFPAWKKSTSGHPGAEDCGQWDEQLYQEKADSVLTQSHSTLT